MPTCWFRGHRPSYHEPVAKIAGKVPLQLCKSCGTLYSEGKIKFRAQKVRIGVLTPQDIITFDYDMLPDPKFMPVIIVYFILNDKEMISCYNSIDNSVTPIIVEKDENSFGFVFDIGSNNQSTLLFSKYRLKNKTHRFSKINRYTRRVIKKFKKSIADQLNKLPINYIVGLDTGSGITNGWTKSGVGVSVQADAYNVKISAGATYIVEFPNQLTCIDEQI